MYTPKEVAENYLSTCRAKAALPLGRMFLLACLAGAFVALAGVASTAAAGLTWGRALLGNLLPVTLGNLVGGVLLVGVSGWYLYLKQGKTTVIS